MMANRGNRLAVPVYYSDKFSWSKKYGNTVEVSDLHNGWSRVWNDACDEGFEIISLRTDKRMLFVLEHRYSIEPGEVSSWTFASVEDPELKIVVFND